MKSIAPGLLLLGLSCLALNITESSQHQKRRIGIVEIEFPCKNISFFEADITRMLLPTNKSEIRNEIFLRRLNDEDLHELALHSMRVSHDSIRPYNIIRFRYPDGNYTLICRTMHTNWMFVEGIWWLEKYRRYTNLIVAQLSRTPKCATKEILCFMVNPAHYKTDCLLNYMQQDLGRFPEHEIMRGFDVMTEFSAMPCLLPPYDKIFTTPPPTQSPPSTTTPITPSRKPEIEPLPFSVEVAILVGFTLTVGLPFCCSCTCEILRSRYIAAELKRRSVVLEELRQVKVDKSSAEKGSSGGSQAPISQTEIL